MNKPKSVNKRKSKLTLAKYRDLEPKRPKIALSNQHNNERKYTNSKDNYLVKERNKEDCTVRKDMVTFTVHIKLS